MGDFPSASYWPSKGVRLSYEGLGQGMGKSPFYIKFVVNMSDQQFVARLREGLLTGDRVALSRAITLIESQRTSDRAMADELIGSCLASGKESVRIAISGPPGVGKSSLIETLGLHVLGLGHRLAVLAIDPSSERSKGSILGDKTRMQRLAVEPQAYVRPSPSSGHLGGVARRTREATILCEAAGYDIIFIETVGVGQSEIAAHQLSDLFLLLLLPGAGDELQGIKRGIVELADMVVVNKADGERLPLAQRTQQEYRRALHLFPPRSSGQTTKVLLTSATEGIGIPELWSEIMAYRDAVTTSGYFAEKRKEQAGAWFDEHFMDELLSILDRKEGFEQEKTRIRQDVLSGRITPFKGADQLIQWLGW